MNNIKEFIIIVLVLILFGLFVCFLEGGVKNYLVEIIFCDNRPPIRITVRSSVPPNSRHIENYNKSVPTYRGYLNVCDLQIIETLNNN